MAKMNLLRAQIAAAGSTKPVKTLAEILGIAEVTARNKLSGKSSFKDWEIKKLAQEFKLKPAEIQKIFFEE